MNFIFIFGSLKISSLHFLYLSFLCFLTDFDGLFIKVFIWWDFKIQWGWSLSDSASGIVVGTVAWAEVTTGADTEIGDWDATEMCADTEADQVLLVCASFSVGLLISKGTDINSVHIIDLILSSVSDKQRFASPFHSNRLTFWDILQFNFSTGHSQNVLSGGHVSNVFVAVTGDAGTDSGGDSDWVHIAQSGLSGSDVVLILDIFARRRWLSVSTLYVVVRLNVVRTMSQGELDSSGSHVRPFC